MALLLHGHQATAASLMEPGLRLSAAETSAMQAALIPLNEAIHALQEPDHAWAKPHMPDVLVFQKAVSEALEHNEFHARNQIRNVINRPLNLNVLNVNIENRCCWSIWSKRGVK